ncbi:serine hydrolase domain-containing protein [Streptomyces sp. B6B3]|uniref:serine hydrolase domain-containing protein n=1 Tax=Streptomyces sp. B6B3 TaxID=3153570 RepID=UPI00325D16AD
MDSGSVRGGIDRRRLLRRGGLTAAGMMATGAVAAGVVATGTPLVGARTGHAAPALSDADIPPDALPGGAYDQYIERLAAEDRFSGVVLLAHQGRTVLSRSYGMADEERGIENHEGVAFNLASASQPFLAVAVLQLLQRGELTLSDTVGTHLDGIATDIAEQVTIHHLLTSTSGIDAPMPDWQRVFTSKEEVHEHNLQWARQATLVGVPGAGADAHLPGGGAGLAMAAQIVETVTGLTFWDYVHEHILGRSGMTGSAYFTRTQWLEDEHIAHPYMLQSDGSRVDAVRNLDKGSLGQAPDRNPGRSFIGYSSGEGFATAPDLVRFGQALLDGTVLGGPYADLLTGAKAPGGTPTSFATYAGPLHLVNGSQWVFGRGGGGGGIAANWNIYLDTGWVGVVLSNYDGIPIQEILQQERQALTGEDQR